MAKLAFERAGDPAWYPEQLREEGLAPWQPLKLYETVLDIARREELAARMKERGIQSWFAGREDETEEERAQREAHVQRWPTRPGRRPRSIDVNEVLEDKLAALREHVTQIGPDNPFMMFTPDEWRTYQPTEDYTLRVSHVPVRIPENDLFGGL